MITNLFSVFDPTSSVINIPMNWMRTVVGITLIPRIFWTHRNPNNFYWKKLLNHLNIEFKTIINSRARGRSLIFISTFLIIILNNSIGLIPYIFTRTRHLMITLAISLPFWITFIIYGWIKNTKNMLAHQVPIGTPNLLIPFIVCIELIRNIIRPRTLAIRLTANIIAGHLLLTLLGNTGPEIRNRLILIIMITAQVALFTLECAVAIIQAYVFSVLTVLYSREVT